MIETERGTSSVLYIREAETLNARLDQLADRVRRRHPGRKISRESLARELLHAVAHDEDFLSRHGVGC